MEHMVNVSELEEKHSALLKEAEEVRNAIEVIKRYGKGGSPSSPSKTVSKDSNSSALNLDALFSGMEAVSHPPTLADEIRDIIESDTKDREYSVPLIAAALEKMGKDTSKKNFRNTLSMHLKKMADSGFLALTHKGKGSDPYRYKKAKIPGGSTASNPIHSLNGATVHA